MLKETLAIEDVVPPSVVSAEEAGLRFVADDEPGISRHRSGNSFRYKSSSGAVVKDAGALVRIRSLVIPPAWTDVWKASNHGSGLRKRTPGPCCSSCSMKAMPSASRAFLIRDNV